MKDTVTKGKSKSPHKKAKKEAWAAFSIFIRTRDCLRTLHRSDKGVCCTCNREFEFKVLQAGHFIPGRNNAVLFQERGVHAQCMGCNLVPPRGKGGNPVQYWLFMEKYYGRKVIDELIDESNQTVKYTVPDLLEIAELYKRKTAELIANPSLARLQSNLDLPF